MARSFHMKLVNGGFGDPALYLQCVWERRAILFDLGQITALRPGEILRISDVFITHTHIDHFIGFDHLLRVMLNRDKTVRFYGPPGLIENVAGKLSGYTWNLVDDYRLRLKVHEVHGEQVKVETFTCEDRFRRRSGALSTGRLTALMEDERFTVEETVLDHSVPCLGFALQEKVRFNINGDRLRQLGWEAGPWLGALKEAIREGRPGDSPVDIPVRSGDGKEPLRRPLREVEAELVIPTEGTKVAYVTDVNYSPKNKKAIIELARDADVFYCEAAFLQRDADHALRKHHLTARQAGELAREAGARHLKIFHYSPKYLAEEELLLGEADEAHRGLK